MPTEVFRFVTIRPPQEVDPIVSGSNTVDLNGASSDFLQLLVRQNQDGSAAEMRRTAEQFVQPGNSGYIDSRNKVDGHFLTLYEKLTGIRFLTNIQRLLAEGLFTATYKYALLAALADLSVEAGDDSGDSLKLSTVAIAGKFVEYYWRHAIPYTTGTGEAILKQNTGQPAKIVSLVADARREQGALARMMRDNHAWKRLVRSVERIVKVMPLWKLQTVGNGKLDFLYEEEEQNGHIELRPGVAYSLRQFYSLIQDAVRSAWLRDVRTLNGELLGETLDLREFLFGAERGALTAVRPVLMELQGGGCFYCGQSIRGNNSHVDHFIPWSKYPIDLCHNFVLADGRCNNKKRDRMPHTDHLARWSERNRNHASEIVTALKAQIPCDLACTNRIAYWAYEQTETANGMTWFRGDELLALSSDWRNYFTYEAGAA